MCCRDADGCNCTTVWFQNAHLKGGSSARQQRKVLGQLSTVALVYADLNSCLTSIRSSGFLIGEMHCSGHVWMAQSTFETLFCL